MKKLFSLFCLLLLTVVVCRAELRTPEQAAQLAAQYLNQNHGTGVAARRAPAAANTMTLYRTFYKQTLDLEVRDDAQSAPARQPQGLRRAGQTEEMDAAPRQTVHIEHGEDEPALYVFNSDNGGFAVISADTRAVDLLCYCDTGTINAKTLNPAFEWWLNRFVEEISSLTDEDEEPAASPRRAPQTVTPIEPLLGNIVWGQSAPFNNKCPIDTYDNTRCVTGCVATAASQIMRYWQYPPKGTGSHSYTWTNQNNSSIRQTLSANFANLTFNWDKMLPSYNGYYSTDQGNAVALLMAAAGYSANMNYGGNSTAGSGAYTYEMATSLRTYFGYINDGYYWLQNYSIQTFTDAYNADLEDGYPILMSGVDNKAGGHAFVCDGRNANNLFHINWGWNGSANCYTSLSSLHPTGKNYYFGNSEVGACINLHPSCNITYDRTTITVRESELPYIWRGNEYNTTGRYIDNELIDNESSTYILHILKLTILPDDMDGMCGDYLYWKYDALTHTLTITGTGAMYDYHIGLSEYSPWNSYASEITNIILPEGMTYLGDCAFWNCSHISTIALPSTLTEIGQYSFAGCSGLTSLTLPTSLKTIGFSAFGNCTGLTSITIPQGTKTIASQVFIGCTSLTSIVWDAQKCYSANSYKVAPFYEIREQVSSFIFGDHVAYIPAYLCDSMVNITSITIPQSVTSIGKSVFRHCTTLTSVTWNASNCVSVSSFANTPFYDVRTQITSFTFGNDVQVIPNGLCNGMSALTSVTIPSTISTVASYLFYDCTGLTSVVIPENITAVGRSAFNGCSGITSLTIGSHVASIGIQAFYGLGISSVTIPASVTSIGDNAFSGCSNLASIRSENTTPPTLGTGVFLNVPTDIPVTVPCGRQIAYKAATTWSNFTNYSTFGDEFPFTLTADVQTEGTGTAAVTAEPDCSTNVATITATPAEHYHFVRWADEDANTESVGAVRNVTVTADASYTAIFEEDPKYTITVNNTDGFGSAETDKDEYYEGETATITLSPAAHYHFSAWSGTDSENISGSGNTFTYTVGTTDREFTVTFAEDTKYTLTLNNDGHGTAATDKASYYEGETATITVTPAAHYHFSAWSGTDSENISGLGNTFTYTVGTTDRTFTVSFAEDAKYTLTLNNDGHGTAATDKASYYEGETATITVTPAAHYHFSAWSGTDSENISGSGNTFTYTVGTTDREFTVTFAEDTKYTLTLNNDGHGTAATDKASYYEGETATITVTPTTHYHFSAWSGTDSENISGSGNTFTYTVGTTNRTFTVSFVLDDNIGGNCEENDGTNLNWNYNVGSGTLTITGTGNMEDYDNDSDMPWYAFRSGINTVAVTDDADQTPLFTWLTTNGGINMTLGRTLYADGYLNTLCLPFDLNAAQVQTFLPHATVYRFVQATDSNGELHIEMEPVTTITAGVPYLLRFPAADQNLSNALFSDVTVTATEGQTVGTGDVTFVGVLRPTGMTSGDTNQLMVGNEDRLFWANDNKNMRAFRAYFQINTGSNSPLHRGMPARVVTRPEVPTDMTETNNAAEDTVRKYMRNGVLVIERNGECYDAQGNKLQ